ncbi:unnamed protein product, partial [Ectocarpus sp. 8 AP-2014]
CAFFASASRSERRVECRGEFLQGRTRDSVRSRFRGMGRSHTGVHFACWAQRESGV